MQAREYKPAAKSAADGSRSGKGAGMPPMLMGIIIGLLLGIMLALAVAIWLNRANTPFLDKSPPVSALPTIAARPSPPPPAKSEKGDPEKPRFEFYQILPGDKGGSTTDRKSAPAAVAVKPAPGSEPRLHSPVLKPTSARSTCATKARYTGCVWGPTKVRLK